MLGRYIVDGEQVDSLDLKMLALTQGVAVAAEVYERFSGSHRISADPYQCNGMFLPDGTVVHVADIGTGAGFRLEAGSGDAVRLMRRGECVTEVGLPGASDFYKQTTSRGLPYRGLAVLEGGDMMAFPYLWPCQYAVPGMTCKFCHTGFYTEMEHGKKGAGSEMAAEALPQDVAEAIHYMVCMEGTVRHIEITGGSTFKHDAEVRPMAEVLRAIGKWVGMAKIAGGIHIYATPPKEAKAIDALFEAGADRVSCNIEVWDEGCAAAATPGKAKWTGKQRHVDTLRHIAREHGKHKCGCTFVLGLEPVESFLAGAEELAREGVVPLASVLMGYGLPAIAGAERLDLGFFRAAKRGLARIYEKYGGEPAGAGSHVSVARDVWRWREEIWG